MSLPSLPSVVVLRLFRRIRRNPGGNGWFALFLGDAGLGFLVRRLEAGSLRGHLGGGRKGSSSLSVSGGPRRRGESSSHRLTWRGWRHTDEPINKVPKRQALRFP